MYSLITLFYLAIKLWENLCNKQDLVCPVTVKDKKKKHQNLWFLCTVW